MGKHLEGDVSRVNGEEDMSHFWMRIAMKNLTIDQGTSADTSANRQIDKITKAFPGTPKGFSQHCSINIRVKADRQMSAQSCPEKTEDIGISQPGFGVARI